MCEDIDLTTIGTDEYIRWIREDRKQEEDKGFIMLDDRELEIPHGSQCILCTHFNTNDEYYSIDRHKCAAFDDIPFEIWRGKVIHDKPYPNDKGIMFSQIHETKRKLS